MKQLMKNTTFDSPLHHALAGEAVSRCNGNADFDAITAVIMSCTAFEAFINEVGQLATTTNEVQGSEPFLKQLSQSYLDTKEPRNSTLDRYDLSWKIIHGCKIEKGRGIRQKLKTLFDLRNELLHTKADETNIVLDPQSTPPKNFEEGWIGKVRELHNVPQCVKNLQSYGLVSRQPDDLRWILRISTKPVAEWSFCLVAKAADELIRAIPDNSRFKLKLLDQSLAGYVIREKIRQGANCDGE